MGGIELKTIDRYNLKFMHLQDTTGGRRAFYKMAVIYKPGEKAKLIKQWGRIGTAGQVKVEEGAYSAMHDEFVKTHKAKTDKNYRAIEGREMKDVEDPNDIHDFLVKQGFTAPGFTKAELSDIAVFVPGELEDEYDSSVTPVEKTRPSVKVEKKPDGWGEW